MRTAIFAGMIFSIVILGGCEKNDDANSAGIVGGQEAGQGTLVVRLIDAPDAYEAVNITVDSVRVHLESGDTLSGWYTISNTPAHYNLLDYAGGRDTIIAESPIPVGYYSQMRLYIGSGCNIVKSGVTSPLEVPSGTQSGLKLNIQATIVAGVKYEVMLDFDANQSIVATGNGRYLLKPVIKVVSAPVSGSLSGTVQPDTTYATVLAIVGGDTSTTAADTTGFFKFKYLSPAIYLLKIVPADTTYRDTILAGVDVMVAQNTDVGTVVLAKK